MGYESEVALALREKDYEKLKEQAKKISEWLYHFVTRPVQMKEVNGTFYAVLHWSNIKWYGEEVDFIETFIQEENPCRAFARIGTEYEDIEYTVREKDKNGECDENLYEILEIHRIISII